MDHLSAAGSSATRNLTTTEPSESLNRRKTVDFRFQRPYATSGSFFFNKPMRAMDSRRDFTSKKVFPGHFSELGEKANSALLVNVFVGDTAHLRVSGKSVCHFLQDFLTGGSGTGFEKEWILLKKRFFALQNKEKKLGK